MNTSVGFAWTTVPASLLLDHVLDATIDRPGVVAIVEAQPGQFLVVMAAVKLIDALPDMFAALEAYEKLDNQVANCKEHEPEMVPESCGECMPFAEDARLKMRAALAKAGGQQQDSDTENGGSR